MTVRTAEIIMAVLMAVVSLAVMYKSTDGLSIGWIAGRGPGAGAWPFWLSAGMFLACVWTIVRWFRGTTEESRSTAPFIGDTEMRLVVITAVALFMLMLISQFFGMYVAILLFLLFYLRFIGRHSWNLTISLAILSPIFLFFFFEWALQIPLPKGWSEPWMVSLGMYDLIYRKGGPGWFLLIIPAGIAVSLVIARLGNRPTQ